MFLELFVCLLLAHFVADFVLQSNRICKEKSEKKWCSVYHYLHAVIVFGLSWLIYLLDVNLGVEMKKKILEDKYIIQKTKTNDAVRRLEEARTRFIEINQFKEN